MNINRDEFINYTQSAKWKPLIDFPVSIETARAIINDYKSQYDFAALKIITYWYYLDRPILVLDVHSNEGRHNLKQFKGFHRIADWHWERICEKI